MKITIDTEVHSYIDFDNNGEPGIGVSIFIGDGDTPAVEKREPFKDLISNFVGGHLLVDSSILDHDRDYLLNSLSSMKKELKKAIKQVKIISPAPIHKKGT